jgi:DNA-binding transcriptional LysR family regulator
LDNRAGEMAVFLRICALGSFSAAAKEVGMTPSSVAKLVTRIESRVGVRLIERSTRKLVLTAEGIAYRERAEAVLQALDAAEQEVAGEARSPSGTIRINASVPLGRHCLLPIVPDFLAAHPRVTLDLSLTDEVVDLYAAGVDIAFRSGALADSGLLATRLGEVRRVVVASPAYLERRGRPKDVADLAHHACMGFNFRRSVPSWPVQERGRLIDREIRGPVLANNGETLRELAIAGVGLARLASFHVQADLAAGRLAIALDDPALSDCEEVHALYLGNRHMPARVRAFLDFAVPRLRQRLAG